VARYYDSPFPLRMVVLVVVLGVVALLDLKRHGRAATKWREYAILLTAAGAAAVLGALNDLFTCTLSPEYFVAGKGLDQGPGLAWRAAALGAQAGFVAGAVAAALLLWANTARAGQRALSWRGLLRMCAAVAGASLAGGAALGLMMATQEDRFRTVQAIHAGLYLGLLAGSVAAVVAVRGRHAAPASGPCGGSSP
jgi:hypothetical protein